MNISRRNPVHDEDYGYLANRLVVEQNLARSATCCASAASHQGLANAYLVRLQSLILSPDGNPSGISCAFQTDWLRAEPVRDSIGSQPAMHLAYAVKGDLI
jgi:hypothetical protein